MSSNRNGTFFANSRVQANFKISASEKKHWGLRDRAQGNYKKVSLSADVAAERERNICRAQQSMGQIYYHISVESFIACISFLFTSKCRYHSGNSIYVIVSAWKAHTRRSSVTWTQFFPHIIIYTINTYLLLCCALQGRDVLCVWGKRLRVDEQRANWDVESESVA